MLLNYIPINFITIHILAINYYVISSTSSKYLQSSTATQNYSPSHLLLFRSQSYPLSNKFRLQSLPLIPPIKNPSIITLTNQQNVIRGQVVNHSICWLLRIPHHVVSFSQDGTRLGNPDWIFFQTLD